MKSVRVSRQYTPKRETMGDAVARVCAEMNVRTSDIVTVVPAVLILTAPVSPTTYEVQAVDVLLDIKPIADGTCICGKPTSAHVNKRNVNMGCAYAARR